MDGTNMSVRITCAAFSHQFGPESPVSILGQVEFLIKAYTNGLRAVIIPGNEHNRRR